MLELRGYTLGDLETTKFGYLQRIRYVFQFLEDMLQFHAEASNDQI